MIDLHTHLLWDWDDGPDDRAQALAMCRIAEKDGTNTICLTPHLFRANRHGDDLDILHRRMVEFDEEVRASEVGIEFHWGAEVYVHAEVVQAVEKYRFTIDQTSYVFLEFAAEGVPVGAGHMLAQLLGKGFVPIISHPERNRGFAARPELLYEFVTMGCAAQVTAGSLTGDVGKEAGPPGSAGPSRRLRRSSARPRPGPWSRRSRGPSSTTRPCPTGASRRTRSGGRPGPRGSSECLDERPITRAGKWAGRAAPRPSRRLSSKSKKMVLERLN
jgi:hypothetical protein